MVMLTNKSGEKFVSLSFNPPNNYDASKCASLTIWEDGQIDLYHYEGSGQDLTEKVLSYKLKDEQVVSMIEMLNFIHGSHIMNGKAVPPKGVITIRRVEADGSYEWIGTQTRVFWWKTLEEAIKAVNQFNGQRDLNSQHHYEIDLG